MTKRFKVRDILCMSQDEVRVDMDDPQYQTPLEFEFDNGDVVESYWMALPYMWLVYEPFRHYDRAEITKDMHVGMEIIRKDTHIGLLKKIFTSIKATYGHEEFSAAHQGFLAEIANNTIHNYACAELGDWVAAISLLDMIEINKHPEIIKVDKAIKPNSASIQASQERVYEVIMKDPELDRNNVAILARSGGARRGNLIHLTTSMGYRTDVNGRVFPYPVMSSIFRGLNLHDAMIESRSACKSLANNKEELPLAEFFQRVLQQVMYALYGPVGETDDCGTDKCQPWDITEDNYKQFEGKFYRDVENGGYSLLSESNLKSMIGRTLDIRSFELCRIPNGGCRKCFGELADSLPLDTAVGHNCEVEIASDPSQDILSTKHNDMVGAIVLAILSDRDKEFLRIKDDNTGLTVNPALSTTFAKVNLIVAKDPKKMFLADVKTSEPEYFRPAKISSIKAMTFECFNDNGTLMDAHHILPVEGSDTAHFSMQMLRYLKEYGWTEKAGKYIIDITEWTKYSKGEPIVNIPLTSNDAVEFSKAMSSVITNSGTAFDENSSDKSKAITRYKGLNLRPLSTFGTDWGGAVKHIFELFALSRHRVNVVHFEALVKSLLAKDPEQNNYETPTGDEYGVVAAFGNVAKRRSIGQSSGLGWHRELHTDPNQFLEDQRPHNPLEQMLVGAELNETSQDYSV